MNHDGFYCNRIMEGATAFLSIQALSSMRNPALISKPTRKKRGRRRNFPETLHEILEDSSSSGTESVVSWSESGKSFTIFKPKVFHDTILPKYSRKRTKFRSFQRQLNIYGFRMCKKSNAYSHPLFQRGDLESIRKIRPVPLKRALKNAHHYDNPTRSISPSLSSSSDEEEERLSSAESSSQVDLFDDIDEIQSWCTCSGSGCCFTEISGFIENECTFEEPSKCILP